MNGWMVNDIEIEEAFYQYFTKLFTISYPSQADVALNSHVIRPKVTLEMNVQINRAFTREEVHVALM